MPFLGLSLIVQILCAVHCVRHSRNTLWLMVIIFLSIPGCIAYLLFEVLPQQSGRREVRAVRHAAIRKLDPTREIRRAREAVDLADTAANRGALGDALAEAGEWADAAAEYRRANALMSQVDRPARLKLARAELESGHASAARDLLETLPASSSQSEVDRAALLLARSVEDCGETERALALYADVGARMAGSEAQCRQAALLLRLGRKQEAVALLAEVESRARRLDRFQRAQEADMYDWAARTLKDLRGEGLA
ncbi:MAG: hypothetical protein JWP15_3653 [Alphaproteobacteria bacterium]|nr:hypothetical protein [Alphaproteobacteria bacterium]